MDLGKIKMKWKLNDRQSHEYKNIFIQRAKEANKSR